MAINRFTIYEHEALVVDKTKGFTRDDLNLLESFFKEKDFPYYGLIRNGVRFNQYVGVLQIKHLVIEVLPKAEADENEERWRRLLIDMLRSVGLNKVRTPSYSSLKLKTNSILDVYIALLLDETERLLHNGLIKRYRKTEGNCSALKGSIQFAKHIQKNTVHKERFYVKYTIYNREHPFNAVLYKTLYLLKQINTNAFLSSRIGHLLLNFPEMPPIKTDEAFFERMVFNRKTEAYKDAMGIAKLLLLNYHPDVLKGKNDVLALMFDMNVLWEAFVAQSLRKYVTEKSEYAGASVSTQKRFRFWQPQIGNTMSLRPDIVIEFKDETFLVLDTKWKNLSGSKPSPDDLRQMYTYSNYHKNAITALVYPGDSTIKESYFIDEGNPLQTKALCRIIEIPVFEDFKTWQVKIAAVILS